MMESKDMNLKEFANGCRSVEDVQVKLKELSTLKP
ncbi:hypothetical protein SYNTR_0180 [Candidatus Syntrophocurvum alkaliphilum]|uniref:Uncharacterized protein n=1 Tax=Candidatus Syntrophocurvum alkaliphilum TaxID=2293317 RepID=A0A6I6D672_9FIRM|nr:hypothetical protein SYNTR_0180 [Candidatus Syntrophocurvum alkaliphilum]